MTSVRALVRDGVGVTLVERSRVAPGRGQVVLRIEAAGICRTDLAVAEGRAGVDGVVLGHECSGRVVAVGEGVDASWMGSRVAVWPFVGGEQLGVLRDGVFADEVTLDAGLLVRVPEALDPRIVAMFEPVVAALAVDVALDGVDRDATVVLLGRNRISRLVERVLRARGWRHVEVVSRAEEVVSARAIIESVADADLLSKALEHAREGTRIVLKSRGWGRATLPLDRIVERSLELKGARYGSRDVAVDLLGRLELLDLVGPSYPLQDWARAFDEARMDEATKVFLLPGGR